MGKLTDWHVQSLRETASVLLLNSRPHPISGDPPSGKNGYDVEYFKGYIDALLEFGLIEQVDYDAVLKIMPTPSRFTIQVVYE